MSLGGRLLRRSPPPLGESARERRSLHPVAAARPPRFVQGSAVTAVRVPSRISELAPDQTDATISVGAGGVSGDLIFQTNGTERARFVFAPSTGGVLQLGALYGGGPNLAGNPAQVLATTRYVYAGGGNGQTPGIQANATVRGTSPAGPTNRYHGFSVDVRDDSTVVNKTITAMSRSGTTVTVTAIAHGFANGDSVGIYGVTHTFNAEINGQFLVANVTADTFDVTLAGLSSGSYTSGGTVTNRGAFYGYYFVARPNMTHNGLTGTAAHGDDIAALAIYNAGTGIAGDTIYVAHNPAFTGGAAEWIDGLSVAANVNYGVILSGWVNNYGFDMASATFPSGAYTIRLPNNVSVAGRNAANSADVQMFKLDTNNRVQFLAPLQIPDSVNINFGTSTGSLIGTSASQMFAFWGKTPIAQPTTSITGATRVGGGGTTVTTADTFGGYTLAQLAAIIKNTGLAA